MGCNRCKQFREAIDNCDIYCEGINKAFLFEMWAEHSFGWNYCRRKYTEYYEICGTNQ